MKMWMIDPKLLCRKHLLGEHGELHKHRHNFVKQHSIAGRLSPIVQIEPLEMERRHNDLAAEMVSRGYKHESPYYLPDLSYLPREQIFAKVDQEQSIRDLCERCEECRTRIFSLMLSEITHNIALHGHIPERMLTSGPITWPSLQELDTIERGSHE